MKKCFVWVLLSLFFLNSLCIPRVARAEESSAFPVWVPTNAEKVMRDQLFPDDRETSIHMDSAKNEYEGAQIILNGQDNGLADLSVQMSSLVHDNGTDLIPGDSIKLYKQHYMNLTTTSSSELPKGWYPDALIPLSDGSVFSIPANQNQGIWMTVKVPKGQAAGLYRGNIRISSGGRLVDVPVELNVWDFELPDERSTQTAFAIWGSQISYYYGLETGSPEYWAMMEKYYWFQNEFRLAPDDLPIPDEDVDAYVAGAERFVTDPRVPSYRLPFYSKVDSTGKTVPDWDKTTQLIQKLRAKGLLAKAYFYLGGWIDEPGVEKYPMVKEFCTKIKEIAPEVRHVVTTGLAVSELAGYVDTWCPTINNCEKVRIAEKQQAGEHVWWYTCVSPKHPFPSYHIDDELLSSRLLSWMQKDYKIEGILYWATDIFQKYNGSAYVDRDVFNDPLAFPGANGDGYLMYPGKVTDVGFDGPVGSLRLESIRDGLEDYEYLVMLEKKVAAKISSLGLGSTVSAADVMSYYYNELYAKMYDFDNNPQKMLEVRKIVAEDILNNGLPSFVPVVKTVSDTEKELDIYAETGSTVKVNGEQLTAVSSGAGYDIYVKTVALDTTVSSADISVEKNGNVNTAKRKFWLRQGGNGSTDGTEVTLMDFESSDVLGKIDKAGVGTSISTDFATKGSSSLKVDFDTYFDYPNIQIATQNLGTGDWSKFDSLSFDLYNPGVYKRELYIKLHSPSGSDDSFRATVEAGQKTKVTISVADIVNNNKADVTNIVKLEIGSWASERYSLYFDNIRVAKKPYETIISDFEDTDALSKLEMVGVSAGISTDYASKGTSSLKVDFDTYFDYPNFQFPLKEMGLGDWSKYDALSFELYNPGVYTRSLYIKFHSTSGSDDSFGASIEPGEKKTVTVKISDIVHNNKADVANLVKLEIGSWATEKYSLYFDNLRLISEDIVTPGNEKRTVLNNFEDSSTMPELVSAVDLSLTGDHKTEGSSALKAVYRTDWDWPGICFRHEDGSLAVTNFKDYDTLEFDLYNANSVDNLMYLKFFKPRADAPNELDSLDKTSFTVPANSSKHVVINLADLDANNFDRSNITRFDLWMYRGAAPQEIYIDNMYLAKASEPEEPPVEETPTVKAEKTDVPLTIDGEFNEQAWKVETGLGKLLVGETGNNTAKFGLLWDDTYLYVGASVKDSILNKEGTYIFNQDAIEIYLDGNHSKSPFYDKNDTQILINYDCSGLSLGAYDISGMDKAKILRKSKITGDGYQMEVAIPWSELDIVPAAGNVMGYDMFNDDNDEGADCQYVSCWAGDNHNWENTSRFGDVKLVNETSEIPVLNVGTPVFKDMDGNPIEQLTPGAYVKAMASLSVNNKKDQPATMVVALFDQKNNLKDFSTADVVIHSGETVEFGTGLNLPQDVAGCSIKAFIVESLDNLKPLSEAAVLGGVSALAAATCTASAQVDNETGLVTISGKLSGGQGKAVAIMVLNPAKGIDYLNQITSGEDGQYQVQYTLDEANRGEYRVKVGGTDVDIPAASAFTYEPFSDNDNQQITMENRSPKVTVKTYLDNTTNTAKALVSGELLKKLSEAARTEKGNSRNVIIELPEIQGALNYSILFDKGALDFGKEGFSIEIRTPKVTAVLPKNAFDGIKGKVIEFATGTPDLSRIPENLRAKIGDKPVVEVIVKAGGEKLDWNNSRNPFDISVRYAAGAASSKHNDQLVVWRIDENGNAVVIRDSTYDARTGIVKFTTGNTGIYAVASAK